MIREVNIDQLHTVVNRINRKSPQQSRRCGYTTAYLYLMLGEVWCGDRGNKYLYIGRSSQLAQRRFVELLSDNDIASFRFGHSVDVTSTRQLFTFVEPTSVDFEASRFLGRRYDRIFGDLSWNWEISDRLSIRQILRHNGDIL